jgi:hypothetical protein
MHGGEIAVLAPEGFTSAYGGLCFEHSPGQYHALLTAAQRLRGTSYVEDGAIAASNIDAEGRYNPPIDSESWHVVIRNGNAVGGCMRYYRHPKTVSFDSLLTRSVVRKNGFENMVERHVARAHALGVPVAEIGGWAVSPERRHTADALRLLFATLVLGKLLGGFVSFSTVTTRNHSARILLELGGESLCKYFDPRYGCDMDFLVFDSFTPPAPCYAPCIKGLERKLAASLLGS